jgi:predicted ATP-grasp superfamily ATP-dependent carboligase
MSQLSDDDIYQEVGKIVANFRILECYECAQAVMQWLAENNIERKVVIIKNKKRKEYFILSTRLEQRGISDSITENGKHYGVEVRGRIFDNLSNNGLTREDWLNDFHCPSEQFIIEDSDKL